MRGEDESMSTTHHHHHCDHQTTRTDHKNGEITCTCCGLIVDSILTDVFGNTIPLKNIKPHSLYWRKHHFNERLSQWLCLTRRVPDSVMTLVRDSLPSPAPSPIAMRIACGWGSQSSQ